MSAPTSPAGPHIPQAAPSSECRCLTVRGVKCRQHAIRGQDHCVAHIPERRTPKFPSSPQAVVVPLLEDHGAIQLMTSQILHGLLSCSLAPNVATAAIACCRVAGSTLARPVAPRAKPQDRPEPLPESVSETETDASGSLIGPREKYHGPGGKFEPVWSVSKYFYEQECESLGRPMPTCAEDFPASGWLTGQEMQEDADDFTERYQTHLKRARAEAQAAKAAVAEAAKAAEAEAAKTAAAEAVKEAEAQTAKAAATPSQPAPQPQNLGDLSASAAPSGLPSRRNVLFRPCCQPCKQQGQLHSKALANCPHRKKNNQPRAASPCQSCAKRLCLDGQS